VIEMPEINTGALEGERMLTKMIPNYSDTRGENYFSGSNGWVASTVVDGIVHESYFDLSGYQLDDLTLFPLGVTLQDPGNYISTNSAVPMLLVDIVSQERLDLDTTFANVISNTMPGMVGTTQEFTQIVWGQFRTLLGQASYQDNATIFLPASGGLFGSGSPTTVQKLWVYRFVFLNGAGVGDTVAVPASRFILNAIIAKEGDKEFLMRMKRSYELAT
jgi:hypothetical protein